MILLDKGARSSVEKDVLKHALKAGSEKFPVEQRQQIARLAVNVSSHGIYFAFRKINKYF